LLVHLWRVQSRWLAEAGKDNDANDTDKKSTYEAAHGCARHL